MRTLESPADPVLQEDLDLIAKSDLPFEQLKGKTVFVTGATGLVGSFVVRALLCVNRMRDLQMTVLALVRDREKGKRFYGELCARDDLQLMQGDILNPLCVEQPVDFILHGASITNSKQMVTYPVETIRTAVNGTDNILAFAKQKAVQSMVYISSMEMYGAPDPALESVSETDYGYVDVLQVRSCYPEGKRMSECLCAAYAHEHGVPVKIARLAQTFGAGVSKKETRVFAQFAKSYLDNTDIVLHTNGMSTGNYCYTRDCVLGLLTILLKGENGQAYNVTNEETNITIRDMAQMLADMNGKIKVVFDIPQDALQYGYAPPVQMKLSSKKLNELGWKAQVPLQQMYLKLMESWQYS
mgnify:CR=1 FL=1